MNKKSVEPANPESITVCIYISRCRGPEQSRFACCAPGRVPQQLLRRNVKWFRGGLVFKAHRLLYLSTLGLRVIKKRRERQRQVGGRNFILIHHLRVKLIINRETRQKCWELELSPCGIYFCIAEKLFSRETLRLIMLRMTWCGTKLETLRASPCPIQGYLAHKKLPPPGTLQ